jgi:exosortase A-associated hydrolase 2
MSTLTSGFLDGPNGKLHVSIFCAKNSHFPRRWVIHVPAFAEEMNKCRPMVSRQARRLVDQGVAVVVPDLSGTGDSEGEFSVATWQAWKNDLKYLLAWAQEQGAHDVTLWGLRLGCLLASEVVKDQGRGLVTGLLFWQPVHSGKQHLTQFLRLRMAAALMKGDSETVAQIRERLLQGQSVEVAGYLLGPDLFDQIESSVMADLTLPQGMSVEILEVVSNESKTVLPVTRNLISSWQALGLDCSAITVQGDPFWMTQEIAFAPSLIEETSGRLLRSDTDPDRDGPASAKSASSPRLDLGLISGRENEKSIVFPCEQEELAGILHRPEQGSKVGVLIVVGGPQYRVGSHRQFVQLARFLCAQGVPVFRFDYRGMGDSSGDLLGFQGIDVDIRCAIDTFQYHCNAVTDIVIWGLCDAATAAISYAPRDARVKGLVLVNPWVYSKQGAARLTSSITIWSGFSVGLSGRKSCAGSSTP